MAKILYEKPLLIDLMKNEALFGYGACHGGGGDHGPGGCHGGGQHHGEGGCNGGGQHHGGGRCNGGGGVAS